MGKRNILSLVKRIQKDSVNSENLNTGLLGEQLIVSAYNQMTLEKLEKLRFVLNHIIKKKKIYKKNEISNNLNRRDSDMDNPDDNNNKDNT